MVLALRSPRKAAIQALGKSTQLDTQAAAVTAVEYTASGAIAEGDNVSDLNQAGSALAMTIDHPTPGRILVITHIDAGTEAHTVTLSNGTFDGTNNRATLNAQNEALVLLGISDDRFLILKNYGSVGLSAV
jgi:hypothetical protein